jgi:ADP-heptose:LPS heptosyltransferase
MAGLRHPEPRRILVIKLGALGDFIQALGPMAAIRRRHPDAAITLLTTASFVSFGQACGYFDHILTDTRPRTFDIPGWLALRAKLRGGRFDRVYDLQNNDRTAFYLRLTGTGPDAPDWVGAAPGAAIRNDSPARTAGHAFDGHVQTLALAGIADIAVDDMAWAKADISGFGIRKPYILLVPGSAPTRPEKRWPAQSYAHLARLVHGWGYEPVIIGTRDEGALARAITAHVPAARDLTGRTALFDIVALARGAAGAIGNDTGPMHLAAATGCPCLVLFSRHSDPVRHAPRGADVRILRADDLAQLPVDDVIAQCGVRTFLRAGGV